MTNQIRFYSDPAHGWYAVKRHELHTLEISDQVSKYSYQRGATVYLEEDRDATLYFDALRKHGLPEPEILPTYSDNNSPIRSYDRYTPLAN